MRRMLSIGRSGEAGAMKVVGWMLLALSIGVLGGFVVRLLWPHRSLASSRSSAQAMRARG